MPVLRGQTGNPNPPQQHSQPSRKGKKAWRKNVNVTDVQKGLEDLNEEIAQGGVVAEKTSGELFILDTAGDVANTKRVPKIKGLKADEIIAARSVVAPVSSKKRAGDKTTDGIVPEKRQRTSKYVTKKDLVRIKKVADGHHQETVTITDATFDPWAVGPVVKAAPTKSVVETSEESQWFVAAPTAKTPSTLAQKPITLAANGKPVPAVRRPEGGYSYNPVVSDYMTRLEHESEKAIEVERKRIEALEAERLRLEATARSAAEAEAAEAKAELSEWDEDSAWEGLSEAEGISVKRPKRKTPAQRNKYKRRKADEGRMKHEALMRQKHEQAKRIKEITEEVEQRQMAIAVQKMEMDDGESEGDDTELRRKQLGRFKLPEKDLELVLPEDLQDSLRLLKPEGNMLKDRYRSLLIRGKIEARQKRPFHRQAKFKLTEKWTHKDFDITKDM